MWIERNRKSVFFHQDTSESDPFILGIQTEWQLQQMIRFGHRSVVAADSTFGVKRLKVIFVFQSSLLSYGRSKRNTFILFVLQYIFNHPNLVIFSYWQYPLFTLLVFDSRQHALPVAWVITRSFTKPDVSKWLKALIDRARSVEPGWKVSGFLIDDAAAEIDLLR